MATNHFRIPFRKESLLAQSFNEKTFIMQEFGTKFAPTRIVLPSFAQRFCSFVVQRCETTTTIRRANLSCLNYLHRAFSFSGYATSLGALQTINLHFSWTVLDVSEHDA